MAKNDDVNDLAPVRAREELENNPRNPDELEKRAKDQESERDKALSSKLPGGDKSKEVREAPAKVRSAMGSPTQGGFMDNMSRRSGADALEGHYVTIDMSHKGVAETYEALGITDKAGNFGIYTEVGSVRDDGTGIPETAVVRLRDATHSVVTVPYEALSPAEPRGR
jgi:hypothetical protein